MSSTTGEFHASNMGSEMNVGSAAVWGSKLYYFTSGSNNDTKLVTCNLSNLQSGDLSGFTSNSNWSKLDLADQISSANGAKFTTSFATACALLNNRLYLFWADDSNQQVYMAYVDQLGNYSSCAYKILLQGNPNSAFAASSNLAANVAPNGTVITLNRFSTQSTKLHTLVLDPADIDDNHKQWVGSEGNSLTPANYGLSAIDSSYYRISSVWFTQGDLGNFSITSFYSTDNYHVYFLLYPIKDDGTPAHTSTSYVFPIGDLDCKRGFNLSRDPAGRVYGIYCQNDDDTDLYYRTFNTFQTVQQDESGHTPTLSWSSKALLNGSTKDSQKGPVAAFVSGNAASGTIQLTNAQNQKQTFTCTNVPQYSVIFYADKNANNGAYDVQVQAANYGTSVMVPSYSTLAPLPQNTSNRIMSLIMDSFPLPNENLGSNVAPNQPLIEYVYGASSTSQLSATLSCDLLFGVKSSLSTTKGVGPAEESEFKTGPQASLSASTQTTSFSNYSVYTTPIVAPEGFATPFKVEAHGEYHGTTLANIVEDIAIFQDPSGAIISGSQAPLFSSLRTVKNSTTAPVSGQYNTYCYTPGDIYSYQQANINQAIAQKYNNLTSQQKKYFTPDYATDYIGKVIIPSASKLFGEDNFLQFTIDGSGYSSETIEQINQVVATLGWTVQGSLYAGVSGGEELSIFGFGEGFDTSLMVGFEYNFSVSGGITIGSTWGIYFDISAPTNVQGALGYTVTMYVCKPSNMWAREIQYFSGQYSPSAGIDFANSSPSKIMFVVSNIINTLPPAK
ncbi:MAG: hypothetical protein HY231_17620 [Acidobacteria bacterium]|nr:hypothetical protein [Acidobacteriota bacterium]